MARSDGYYMYLTSSLPALSFGAKPPLSFKKFISSCEGVIPQSDVEALKSVPDVCAGVAATANIALKKWRIFDRALRNELVKIRAARKKVEASRYMREDGFDGITEIAHIAIAAHRKTSLIEAERYLDAERWRYLDEIVTGRSFYLDSLVVYAVKLIMLERWDRINSADRRKAAADILDPM
jgi:hypothetical protein